MSAGLKLTKAVFFIVDILFLLMGIGMVGVGAFIQMSQADVLGVLVDSKYVTVPLVMIAAGIIVLIVSIIGFIGAAMNQRCCLIMFVVCVLFVLTMELAVGIVAFLYQKQIETTLETELLDGLKNERSHSSWDGIQKTFRCCGVNNATDWYLDGKTTVPDSCCKFETCGQQGVTLAYFRGCFTKTKEEIKKNFYYLGAVGIGLGVCQILAIISGIALLCSIWRDRSIGKRV